MIINSNSKFVATLTANDARTGWKKGKKLYPKGVYWQRKNVILVGDVEDNNTIRVALPSNIVSVEVVDSIQCDLKEEKEAASEHERLSKCCDQGHYGIKE